MRPDYIGPGGAHVCRPGCPHPLHAAMFTVEAATYHGEWDTQPAVYTIHTPDPNAYAFAQVALSRLMWTMSGGNPITVLESLSRGMTPDYVADAPDDARAALLCMGSTLRGAALFTEGWAVFHDDADNAEMREYARTRTIHRHPARREVRTLYAVTLDGPKGYVIRPRGDVPGVVDTTGQEHNGQEEAALAGFLAALHSAYLAQATR